MIKICHVSTLHSRYDIRIFHKECRSLARAGYHVTLLVFDGNGNEIKDDVHIIDRGAYSNLSGRLLAATTKLIHFFNTNEFDLLHFHDPELIPSAFYLKMKGYCILFDMHENLPAQIHQKKYIPWLFKPSISFFVKILQLFMLKNTPTIFAEDSYKKDFPWIRHHTFVRNYPDLASLNMIRKLGNNKTYSLSSCYIGSITEERGLFTMLNVIKIFKQNSISSTLTIVGALREKINFTHYADIIDNVKFTGFLPSNDAWKLTRHSLFGFCLLKPKPNYMGSLPTKVMEYISLGIIPVLSDFPFYRHFFKEIPYIIFVDPDNPKLIADEMITYFNKNKENIPAIKKTLVDKSKNFDWKYEEKNLKCFYKEVLTPITLG